MPREEQEVPTKRGGDPPPPPPSPAPGEHGHRQARTTACQRQQSARTMAQNETRPVGIGATSSPPTTIHDRSVRANNPMHRKPDHFSGAGTAAGISTMMDTAPVMRGGTDSTSPPPDLSQDTTALPSSPLLLSPNEVARSSTMPPPDNHEDDEEDTGGVAMDGFRPVEGGGGLQPLPPPGYIAAPPSLLAPPASPSRQVNPFEVLRTASSEREASPVLRAPTMALLAITTLRSIVDAGFDEVFGDTGDRNGNDTRFRLRTLFHKGAHLVDTMIYEEREENSRLVTRIESQLNLVNEVRRETSNLITRVESQLDQILQRLPMQLNNHLVAVEHVVGALQDVRPVLGDLRHRQLTKIWGDIGKVQEGIEELKPDFCQGLDDMNLRVDDILTRMGKPLAHDTPCWDISPPVAARADGMHVKGDDTSMARPNTVPPMVAPVLRTEDVSGTEEGPACGGMGVTPHTGQRWVSGDTSGECTP
jgi:hypothetical protein